MFVLFLVIIFSQIMNNLEQLHEKDLNLWLEQVTQKIKNRDFADMDWNSLIEELEDMGASQKRALRSYFLRLIEHILKLKFWHSEYQNNKNHWGLEIRNFRTNIKAILEDSPSLKRYLQENQEQWQKKVIQNVVKSGLFTVEDTSTMSLNEVLEEDKI